MRRLRGEDGVAPLELLGMTPYLLLAALAGWQLLLAGAAVAATEQAARTGGRVAAGGGDGVAAAEAALPVWLDGDAEAGDGLVALRVRIPVLVPGLDAEALAITRSAEFPRLGAMGGGSGWR